MLNASIWILIAAGATMFLVIGGLSMMSHHYTLGNIKSRTVGDGQHGTARWATDKEIKQTYAHVPFKVREWRSGQNLPSEQGLILGCKGKPQELTALVDSDDIHCLMIGASGIGKTAFFLYPNLEYACASGMSWLALDSKGDLARNYGTIAKNCYGYNVSVIDLGNPTRSDGNNLLTLVNRYMDIARKDSTACLQTEKHRSSAVQKKHNRERMTRLILQGPSHPNHSAGRLFLEMSSSCQPPLICLAVYILKILITSIADHQFIVGSLFHNFSILDKQDLVYILNRGQPVCNHDNCFASHQFLESLLQLVFIFRICSCRSLIHNDDIRIL